MGFAYQKSRVLQVLQGYLAHQGREAQEVFQVHMGIQDCQGCLVQRALKVIQDSPLGKQSVESRAILEE
uniref:Uncharacterized protein n=1 Tax=Sphaerodactylus townsendi TaxID=933632 RepID=A0ACB8F458_9SAUR